MTETEREAAYREVEQGAFNMIGLRTREDLDALSEAASKMGISLATAIENLARIPQPAPGRLS